MPRFCWQFVWSAFLLAAICAAPASSAAQEDFEFGEASRFAQRSTRKTLLSWAGAADEEDGEDDDRLVTDRPHFSEASSLVGLGRVQLETGYTFFRDTDAGTIVSTHSFPEPLLRVGVFAEWFELRLGYNYLIEQTSAPGIGSSRLRGSDDMYLGAKLALAEQQGVLPEIAIFPQTRIPTGGRAFTAGQMLPGFNLAYSWKLNRLLELECNTQLNRRVDDVQHYYAEFIQTANLEYDISKYVGAFTEWFVLAPNGALAAHTQHYFHGGFQFFLRPNVQFDLHAGVGLNRAADNLALTGGGFSVRY